MLTCVLLPSGYLHASAAIHYHGRRRFCSRNSMLTPARDQQGPNSGDTGKWIAYGAAVAEKRGRRRRSPWENDCNVKIQNNGGEGRVDVKYSCWSAVQSMRKFRARWQSGNEYLSRLRAREKWRKHSRECSQSPSCLWQYDLCFLCFRSLVFPWLYESTSQPHFSRQIQISSTLLCEIFRDNFVSRFQRGDVW